MMRKENMVILKKSPIAQDTIEMVLENKYISNTAVPGQFLHLQLKGHMLRRPISISQVDEHAETVTILFKVVGSGTKELASYPIGNSIDVLGPSGNGFPLEPKANSTILIIGGGIGVPPLYYLARKLKEQQVNIVSVLGFQTKESVFYEEKFAELGRTIIVTNDGSYGRKGFVTNVLDDVSSIDCYYSCGPLPMLQAITAQMAGKHGYISLEERMGCGVGACFACVIPTDDCGGYKKICKDGPVFPAQEVQLV
ncbi:MAG: dihydroorotate dehydrogenase electron transfer subunit [Bacillota bacterium]|uniref:Dihydroorotate dehydrogenase B (NAD(+)), electron transfer subunit n=2 Tax=Virgibacillus salarius TaxID=447199 RepID=A0A941DT88_9BACI|nr:MULTISPECIES: dihydroorotate dehydrogenase electron transfer subunit [Bacillaceae]MBR7795306.1 dihydroorotate dehydrogenase electron transfer subunit [Virgibacillus salarius]MCC2252523.1 dihydroorotate dehydrogenase electron transfer subunit [Virgibacillus sp. AGTR]NAZ08021.1 dihydroorotate dehydrogenase electron transfer subunit [Agaribacter marinus]QRZ16899.1 dihydroorotate dehydrogenase electron transfer subunit [Virgibacillus sp. AGTR]